MTDKLWRVHWRGPYGEELHSSTVIGSGLASDLKSEIARRIFSQPDEIRIVSADVIGYLPES